MLTNVCYYPYLIREPGKQWRLQWHLLLRLQPPTVYDGIELLPRLNTPILRDIIIIISQFFAAKKIVGLDSAAQVQLWRVGFCTCPIKPIQQIILRIERIGYLRVIGG